MRLDGKVALVSGAARGIGAAIAGMLAAEGAIVGMGDILGDEGREVEAAERLVVPRTVAQRHAPQPGAGVHVEGSQLRVRWLEER